MSNQIEQYLLGMSKYIKRVPNKGNLKILDVKFFLDKDKLGYDANVSSDTLPSFYSPQMIETVLEDLLDETFKFFPLNRLQTYLNKLYINGDLLYSHIDRETNRTIIISPELNKLFDSFVEKYTPYLNVRVANDYTLTFFDNSIDFNFENHGFEGINLYFHLESESVSYNGKEINLDQYSQEEIKDFMFYFNDLSTSNYTVSDIQSDFFSVITMNNSLITRYFDYSNFNNVLLLNRLNKYTDDIERFGSYSPTSYEDMLTFLNKF